MNELVDTKCSVNDFVIKACAKALVEVPVCNSNPTSPCTSLYLPISPRISEVPRVQLELEG